MGIGLELLKFSEESAINLSRGIDAIAAASAKDGKPHDITIASSEAASGITVHCNDLRETVAGPKLRRHCELRKYTEKADKWAGLVIEPGTGSVRFGGLIEFPWKADAAMELATAGMAPPQPIKKLPSMIRRWVSAAKDRPKRALSLRKRQEVQEMPSAHWRVAVNDGPLLMGAARSQRAWWRFDSQFALKERSDGREGQRVTEIRPPDVRSRRWNGNRI